MNKSKDISKTIDIHTPIVSKHTLEDSPNSITQVTEKQTKSVKETNTSTEIPEISPEITQNIEIEIEIPKIKRSRRKEEDVEDKEEVQPQNKRKKLIVSDNFVKLDLNRRKIRTLKSHSQKPKTRKPKLISVIEPTFTIYDPISLYIDYKSGNIPETLKSKIPLCYHSEPAIVKKVVSKNHNFGRSYYRCRFSKDMKCDFFIWKDDVIYNIFKPLEEIESKNNKIEEEEETDTEEEEESEDFSDENLNGLLNNIYEGNITKYKPKQLEIIKSILNHHNTVFFCIYVFILVWSITNWIWQIIMLYNSNNNNQ